jgi:hypothetical protein
MPRASESVPLEFAREGQDQVEDPGRRFTPNPAWGEFGTGRPGSTGKWDASIHARMSRGKASADNSAASALKGRPKRHGA